MRVRTRSLLAVVVVSLAACLAGAADAGAAVLTPDSTFILSGAPSLLSALPAPAGNAFAGPHSVSEDGSRVAFASSSDGLSGEDDDTVVNVYVKDMRTGAVTLASPRTGPGSPGPGQSCFDPAISDDGNRVAFDCRTDPTGANPGQDVYVHDLTTGQTILVSPAEPAPGGNPFFVPRTPALDRDGTHVAFVSRVGDGEQVFMRDVPLDPQHSSDGTVMLVSRPDETTGQTLPADGFSFDPSISDDGTQVAFVSTVANLVAGDTGTTDMFVRTLAPAPKTELVSRNTAGQAGNGAVLDAMISGDGTTVAFTSRATNVDPVRDPSSDADVYVRTLGTTPATRLADLAPDGTKAAGGADSAAIDDHGTVVAFRSRATNIDPADTNRSFDVYVADLGGATPVATLASRVGASGPASNSSASAPSLSGDGTQVLTSTIESLVGDSPHLTSLALRTIATGAMAGVARPGLGVPFVNEGGTADEASISADGRYVAMRTIAPALGVEPGMREAIVVRDTHTGGVVVASRADGAGGAPLPNEVFSPVISADGRRVAFVARSRPGDTTSEQVLVRDLVSGQTILVSRADGPDGAPADRASSEPSISADGTHVAFFSGAVNLSPDATDELGDVYVRDLAKGTTVLVDRADGPAGARSDDGAIDPSLSADGQHVAFESRADNLGTGGVLSAVYVRDLANATTRLASVGNDGRAGNEDSFLESDPLAAISADGSRVAFTSASTSFGTAIPADGTTAFQQVWVRDLAAGRTILASRADGAAGAPADTGAEQGFLSADGHVVAFGTVAQNLAAGMPAGVSEVYRRDLEAGTTRLVSRASGPGGAPAPRGTTPQGMTSNGECAVFLAGSDLLDPALPGARDYSEVFLRTFGPDCKPPVVVANVRPVLKSVSLSHARFRIGKARTAIAAAKKKARRKPVPRGTVLSFTSNKAAKLSIKIERVRPGHKVKVGKGKARKTVCRAVRKRVKRGRCTVYSRVATLTRKIKTGRGRVALSGRIGKKAMAPGTYRLTLTARDAAGAVSAPVRRSFTVLRG